MKLRTYQAESMAAALAKVKAELGRSAVILHTRSFKRGGFWGWRAKTIVEITATKEADSPPRSHELEPLVRHPAPVSAQDDSRQFRVPAELAAAPRVAASKVEPPLPSQRIYDEIETIRRLVGDVLAESRRGRMPDLPDDLLEMYTRLIGQQVADEVARRLIDEVGAAVDEDHPGALPAAELIQARLMDRIAMMLPDAAPLSIDTQGRPKIVALVGPTGVGKTTTIAKLAAHFKLREHRRVGLITVDTYRIAAVEQLKVYANILEIPVCVVVQPADMINAVGQMADCDLILIDTAGRSPRDSQRIEELKQYLTPVPPDEVHLVVSTTATQESVMQTIQNFAPVNPHRLIFTKLDEAVGFGLILNVLANVEMHVSYLTHGQSVPNDIEVAHGRRLAELILGKKEERAAHRDRSAPPDPEPSGCRTPAAPQAIADAPQGALA